MRDTKKNENKMKYSKSFQYACNSSGERYVKSVTHNIRKVKFGEFSEVKLRQYLKKVDRLVERGASKEEFNDALLAVFGVKSSNLLRIKNEKVVIH